MAPLWRRVQADLADPGGVEKLVEHIGGRPVDVLAVNAGDGVNGEFAGDTLCEEQLRVVDLNVRSAVHLTKRVLPMMGLARSAGRSQGRSAGQDDEARLGRGVTHEWCGR